MTRWLLLVLMVLLPAQFSWAAAAPYCAHESQPTSFHVGHHAHVHEGAPADAPAASPAPDKAAAGGGAGMEAKEKEKEAPRGPLLAPDHADCHYCHAAVGQPASSAAQRFERPARDVFLAAAADALRRGRDDRIERPKWTRAA